MQIEPFIKGNTSTPLALKGSVWPITPVFDKNGIPGPPQSSLSNTKVLQSAVDIEYRLVRRSTL